MQLVETISEPVHNVRAAHLIAVQQLVDLAMRLRGEISYRAAVAGNGSTLLVPGSNRRIYVQLGAAGGSGAEARVDTFLPALGDGILLQRSRILDVSEWLVMGWLQGVEIPCANE